MAEKKTPKKDKNEEYISVVPAEASGDDDLIGYIRVNSLDALKARFGAAEEDEKIRSEGFELAKSGGLIRKPRPETDIQFYSHEANPKDDIPDDKASDLSKVFDSAKSEHDNDNIDFGDLGLKEPEKEKVTEPEKPFEEVPEEKPKRKRRTKAEIEADKEAEAAAKSEAEKESKAKSTSKAKKGEAETKPKTKSTAKTKTESKEETKTEPPKRTRKKKEPGKEAVPEAISETEPDNISDDEEIQIVRKFKTNTRVIFVDETLDDGIKRNTESELEGLFEIKTKEKKRSFWSRFKK